MPASRRFPLLLIGAFLALYLVWGSTYLFIRIGVELASDAHGRCALPDRRWPAVRLPALARRAGTYLATMAGGRGDRFLVAQLWQRRGNRG